eukprot:g12762.t1
MSSKITKQMISRVDEMVKRASSATKETGLSTSKRKAAKRALLQAPSKRKSRSGAAAKSTRGVSKSGERIVGLLDKARRELRGKSRVARNVSLLSYKSRGASQEAAGERGLGIDGAGVVSKSRKAVEHLLQLDAKEHRDKCI